MSVDANTAGAARPNDDDDDDATSPEPVWRRAPTGPRWGLSALSWLFGFVPLRLAYVLVLPTLLTWHLHFNHPRHSVRAVMRRLGRRRPEWDALKTSAQFAFTLVDRWYVEHGRLAPRVDVDGGLEGPLALALLDTSRPLVVLGCHCGALEMASGAFAGWGRVVRAVAIPDPRAQPLLEGVGDSSEAVPGGAAAIVADGSPFAGLAMLRALKSGQVLALKVDRLPPKTLDAMARGDDAANEAIAVPFLDGPADDVPLFPLGPARLTLRAKASAVALFCDRIGPGRYEISGERLEASEPDELVRAWVAAFERAVRRRPHQWFNFFPYWPADTVALEGVAETVPPVLTPWRR